MRETYATNDGKRKAGGIAGVPQGVKGLPCKHKDLNSNPRAI